MNHEHVVFSGHSVRRMFERAIGKSDVLDVLKSGKKIAEYPDDKPFPSYLTLGFVGGRPLHVVAAIAKERKTWHIVTVYDPDPALWDKDFEKRR